MYDHMYMYIYIYIYIFIYLYSDMENKIVLVSPSEGAAGGGRDK
jgi:hypothetical protein